MTPFRPTTSLGARQRLPAGPGTTLANTSDTLGRLRPRSHSPNILNQSVRVEHYQTHGREGKVQQQSRSLDERRSRISRQRNSSFSTLNSEETQQPVYSAPPPPTITLRRPSMTCLQPGDFRHIRILSQVDEAALNISLICAVLRLLGDLEQFINWINSLLYCHSP